MQTCESPLAASSPATLPIGLARGSVTRPRCWRVGAVQSSCALVFSRRVCHCLPVLDGEDRWWGPWGSLGHLSSLLGAVNSGGPHGTQGEGNTRDGSLDCLKGCSHRLGPCLSLHSRLGRVSCDASAAYRLNVSFIPTLPALPSGSLTFGCLVRKRTSSRPRPTGEYEQHVRCSLAPMAIQSHSS